VIYCAVGGRTSLLGAIYGALMVNWARTSLSERFPELWLLALGSLFILVVVAFPEGLAGVYRKTLDPWLDRLLPWLRRDSPAAAQVQSQAQSPAALPAAPVTSAK
jgi:urea transport system permease protein